MNCADCQNQIFDGELDRFAVTHFTECDDCRALEHEVRLNAVALAGFREEVLPVRTPRRRWPWVAAATAAAAIVAIAIWPNSIPAPTPTPAVAMLQPIPAALVTPSIPVVAKPAPVRRTRSGRPKPASLTAQTEPLMVKFFTDDPDVVIYWLIDPPKGEVGL